MLTVSSDNESSGDIGSKSIEKTESWYKATLNDDVDFEYAYKALLESGEYLEVQPNYIYTLEDPIETDSFIDTDDNNPKVYTQTWLSQIHAFEAWDLLKEYNLNTVTVAVVDTGVDLDHPDLKNIIVTGRNFTDNAPSSGNTKYDDQQGHGTHVAGIIAAINNDIGVRGVSYNTKIMPVRVLNAKGSGYLDDIAYGIKWAANNGAKIINMSLGGFGEDTYSEDAIAYARSKGVLVIVAAGNEAVSNGKTGNNHYGVEVTPADIEGVFTVMAQAQRPNYLGDWLTDFSNYDPSPGTGVEYEIMAPGDEILSTEMGGDYCFMSGTSMATPVTVGAAAVLAGMGCNDDEIWNLLVKSGDSLQGITLDGEPVYYPALNLENAVQMKLDDACPVTLNMANCKLTSSLSSVSMNYTSVNLARLNTSDKFIYKNGSCLSSLSLSFEVFGSSGNFTISGTVGGRTVNSSSYTLETGDYKKVNINWSGTPTITNKVVPVRLNIADKFGNVQNVSYDFPAYTLDMPGGISYSSSAYSLNTNTVTISPENNSVYTGVILCLDTTLNITGSQKLVIDDAIIYFGSSGKIVTGSDSSKNNLEIYDSVLIGYEYSTIDGSGCSIMNNCYILDPKINYVKDFDSNMVTDYVSGTNDVYLYAGSVHESSFFNSNYLTVKCDLFYKNLVNRCYYADMYISKLAQADTFVENYLSSKILSALDFYVYDYSCDNGYTDYSASADINTVASHVTGMRYCSVVGPMDIIKTDSLTKIVGAKIYGVYYQAISGAGISTGLYCNKKSTKSTDASSINSWGFGSDSPVFVTGVSYSADVEWYFIDFTITYTLSTAISSDSSPYLTSDTSDLAGNDTCTISSDGKSVVAKVSAITEYTSDNDYDYDLYGIYTKANSYSNFENTALEGQNADVVGTYTRWYIYSFSLAKSGSNVNLTWSDSRFTSGNLLIYRSVDDGPYYHLIDVPFTNGKYTDTDVEQGHKYSYRIVKDVYYRDSSIVLTNSSNSGFDINVVDNTIAVSLNSAISSSKLEYTLPSIIAGSIEFSEAMRGLAVNEIYLGVKDGTNNTKTIYLGDGSTSYNFPAGELFRVKPENGYIPVITGYSSTGQMVYFSGFGNTTIKLKDSDCDNYSIILVDPSTHKPVYGVYTVE